MPLLHRQDWWGGFSQKQNELNMMRHQTGDLLTFPEGDPQRELRCNLENLKAGCGAFRPCWDCPPWATVPEDLMLYNACGGGQTRSCKGMVPRSKNVSRNRGCANGICSG